MNQVSTTPSIMTLADLATPMAIRVAATLGLAERAGYAGATAEHLATETGTVESALRRMLDHLVTVGVFDFDAETGLYRTTALGAQMGEDVPAGVKPLLDINCAGGRAELAFVYLLETINTGAPAYPRLYGRTFWADLDAEPNLRSSFDRQMTWRFREKAPQIAQGFDWSRFRDIVDVGGGDGQLLIEILQAHPGVRGTILDLAPTAASAAERLAVAGVGDRARTVASSFFDPLPRGADAYLLSDILHDWDDEHARRILTECRRAAAPDASVVLIEPVRGYGTNTAIDLFLLMCFGGQERTIDELTELGADCGLVFRNTVPVTEGRMALELTVAEELQAQ